MKLSVVICTYNRTKLLRGSIETACNALLRLMDNSYELLVIDNNSSDETAIVVKDFQKKFEFIKYVFEPNQGLSYARNRGINESRGDIIAFIDDDVKVHPDWAVNLLKYFEDPEVMCVGGRIFPWWEVPPPKWLTQDFWGPIALLDHGEKPKIMPNTHLWGANLSFRKKVFEKYGFFDVNLGRKGKYLLSGEETRFLSELIRNNEKVIYAPDVIVWHFVPKERMKRTYFLKWKFYNGISCVLVDDLPVKRTFLSVPLYFYRYLLLNILRVIKEPSFKNLLLVCDNMGRIYGARLKYKLCS